MNARLLAHVLALRAQWRRRERWDATQITAHRSQALARLRARTYAHSAFYRRHHTGLLDAPLAELPPVTKAELMTHFDEAVTVPGLRRAEVEAHLQALVASDADPGSPWRGRWWAAATAGTTGQPGVFEWDRSEWATLLASYARANDWAQVPAGLTHPLRMAVTSSRVPTHQSAVVGASVQFPLVPTLRLDATSPLFQTVAALNTFGPRLLVGYPSVLRPLATEQLAGRLMITPQAVLSAAEVHSLAAATGIKAAWGRSPSTFMRPPRPPGLPPRAGSAPAMFMRIWSSSSRSKTPARPCRSAPWGPGCWRRCCFPGPAVDPL